MSALVSEEAVVEALGHPLEAVVEALGHPLGAAAVASAYSPEEEAGAHYPAREEVKLVERSVQVLYLGALEFVGHQPHDKGNLLPSVARLA